MEYSNSKITVHSLLIGIIFLEKCDNVMDMIAVSIMGLVTIYLTVLMVNGSL